MEAFIDADGLKTFYVKAGSGFPVVLFHGAAPGASAQVNWQLNIEPLAAAGFTVYAYDQAGYGRSDNPADLSIEYRVTHAKAFVDALKLDRYHVVGNSVGGYIAARLALEDPRCFAHPSPNLPAANVLLVLVPCRKHHQIKRPYLRAQP